MASTKPSNDLNPEFEAEQERLRLQGQDPDTVYTIPDRVYTEIDMGPDNISVFRPMTDEEIDKHKKSKSGKTKVRPADLKGPVPVVIS